MRVICAGPKGPKANRGPEKICEPGEKPGPDTPNTGRKEDGRNEEHEGILIDDQRRERLAQEKAEDQSDD